MRGIEEREKALNLHFREGMGYKRIAKEMNLPVQTVKSWIHRYRKKQGMLSDCQSCRLDNIVVRTVSRLSCDVVETLAITRKLKALGIEAIFMDDGIAGVCASNPHPPERYAHCTKIGGCNLALGCASKMHTLRRGVCKGVHNF